MFCDLSLRKQGAMMHLGIKAGEKRLEEAGNGQ